MKSIIAIVFSLFLTGSVQAQLNFGIKIGASTSDIGVDHINVPINQSMDELKVAIEKANYGFNFGAVFQIRLKWFVIQPEVIFNSTSVDFRVNDNLGNYTDKILTDSYQNLDIPFLFGLKAGPLRMQAGPVGHIPIQYASELTSLEGFSSDFSPIEYGYQAGIGIDFYNLMIDFRYEGNFNKFGEYITFYDRNYSFSDMPTRLLLSIAIAIN
ncbi:PorT family protein [Membranicola marinus]|uniref:PorT family protein n=1 Tax=Membranihabitans marinus TaxID=1227546 RepID=A0A953HRG7_9BACT|nr:outer membrane beta-barrel protein [Membranihabitans marinus]MBY5957020.1 PorT family protein [Membranihabitans marinus]